MSFSFTLLVTCALSIGLLGTKPRSVDPYSYIYYEKPWTEPEETIFSEDFQFQKDRAFDRRVSSGTSEQVAEATFYR